MVINESFDPGTKRSSITMQSLTRNGEAMAYLTKAESDFEEIEMEEDGYLPEDIALRTVEGEEDDGHAEEGSFGSSFSSYKGNAMNDTRPVQVEIETVFHLEGT